MWVPRWFKWLNDSLHTESGVIQDALKEQSDAISVDRESAKHEQNEAARIIAGAINNASSAAASYEQPQRNKEYGLQVAIVVLTFLTAIGAIGAAVASWRTLTEIKKSTDAATDAASAAKDTFEATYGEEGTIDRTMQQMTYQTATAQQAASTAKNAVSVTQQQMRLDERAWVGVGNIVLTLDPSKPVKAETRVAVLGKSPALDVVTVMGIKNLPAAHTLEIEDITPDRTHPIRNGTVFPNATFPIREGGSDPVTPEEKSIVDAIIAKTEILYFFGEITYQDIFNVPHWTHFCYVIPSATADDTRPCTIYNDSDADKQNNHKKSK